jgi:hypothetical protein
MAHADLRALHRLHLVDAAIAEIRKRAAALDPGKAIQAQIAKLIEQEAEVGGRFRELAREQQDLELQRKAAEAKIAQIERDLYGGKVVNPREVENLTREVEAQKRRIGALDDRLIELLELIPPAKQAAEDIQAQIDAKRGELAEHQKQALKLKAQLEAQFKEVTAKRPGLAAEVPPALLPRYEAIRKNQGGIGMADVVRGGFCGMCGTHLPEKLIESAREGRVATCESCHRILYASEGLV